VTSHYRHRVVEAFVFLAILRCVTFRVVRRRVGISYGPIFISQISTKNSEQLVDRSLCGEMLRVVVFSRVVNGHKPSGIEDTDTLVPSIGQFNLSQNRKLSLHTNSTICIHWLNYECVLISPYPDQEGNNLQRTNLDLC